MRLHDVKGGFLLVMKGLDDLTSASQNVQTRGGAQVVLNSLLLFGIFCHLYFGEVVLKEINTLQNQLQTPGLSLDVCVSRILPQYSSLIM